MIASCLALVFLALSAVTSLAQADNYVIGAQDVLNIVVYEQADIGGKFTVENDGTFSFWQLGRLKAKGMTVREFEADLTKRLRDGYFKDPHVSVSVDQYKSQRFIVTGEVRNPGTYPLTGGMSLIEALARAGSTSPDASGEVLVIPARAKNAVNTDKDIARFSLKDLVNQNVTLSDGDTVIVPRAESVYVFGEVKNPGAYSVKPETTVLQALSLAGGTTPNAAVSRIRIVRMENGKKKELKAKLSDIVRPGDTIIVPERYF